MEGGSKLSWDSMEKDACLSSMLVLPTSSVHSLTILLPGRLYTRCSAIDFIEQCNFFLSSVGYPRAFKCVFQSLLNTLTDTEVSLNGFFLAKLLQLKS